MWNLKQIRQRRLLSIRELAARSGLSPKTVYDLESGKVKRPHYRTMRRLSDALSVDVERIVEFQWAAGRLD